MKRILSLLLVLVMVVGASVSLSSCASKGNPPELDEVYDRLVQVIEASHEVNVLLFGAGVPVYPYGDAEDELVHRYYGVADNGLEFVTPYAKYVSIMDMKSAISAVYSEEYRQSLYESLFTGYADGELSVIMPARFSEDDRYLYQNKHVDPLVEGVRVYDYATMEIMKGSNASRIRVSVSSYSESYPDLWKTVYLSFVFENGDWYLDSPSC
ncbi:MAG: hypothetical protein IKU90_06665 [Clostridia bacterium]|nr:hypothetical protein [Clostridia bacterium]